MTSISESGAPEGDGFGLLRTAVQGVARALRRLEAVGLPLFDWPSPQATTWINAAQVVAWAGLALVVRPFVSQTDPAVMTPGGSFP
jgi:hypothetical protein